MTTDSSVRIAAPEESWWDRIVAFDARNFGIPANSFTDPVHREVQPLDRFRIALVGDRLAGAATSVPLTLTLPGGAHVPVTGVTWVSVSAAHRRRGVLTRLLDAVHADGRSRGEVAQILFASEAPIYGRFGYGEVTTNWEVALDAASVRLHRAGIAPGDTVPVDDDAGSGIDAHVEAVFDEHRRRAPGEVDRLEARWRMMRARWSQPRGDALPVQYLTCEGGYAAYRLASNGDTRDRGGRPGHVMTVVDLVALTQPAHRSLWQRLVNTDLVATIECGVMAPDDPLPLMLADRRWLRTMTWHDGLWMRAAEPAALLGARRYDTEDCLTLEVKGRTFMVDTRPASAHVALVDSRAGSSPDLVVDPWALGPLVMGSGPLRRLVDAGLVTPSSEGVLARAGRLFASDRPPQCSTHF